MKVYHHWNNSDCSASVGIVKVVSKPLHGKLIPVHVASRIPHNRMGSNDSCFGKPAPGFEVRYTASAGFHGTDSFVIEVTYGNQAPVTDSYSVSVQ